MGKKKLLERTVIPLIVAISSCFALSRVNWEWALTFKITGIGLAVFLTPVVLILLLTRIKSEKVQTKLVWIGSVTRRGTKLNKLVVSFLFDVILVLIIILIPIFTLYFFTLTPASQVKNNMVWGIHLVLSFVGLGVLFAYRRHRRKEHVREKQFCIALLETDKLTQDLQNLLVSTPNELWNTVDKHLQEVRRILILSHDGDEDPDLSVWLYEHKLSQQHFKCKLIAYAHKKLDSKVGSEIEKVRNEEIVPFYVAATIQKHGKEKIELGSLCSRTLLEIEQAPDGYIPIERCDSFFESEDFNPSFLSIFSKDYRKHFLGTSYIRAGLTCKDNDPFSTSMLAEYVFPVFVMHSKPSYFTDYDKTLLRIIFTGLSKFLCKHTDLLVDCEKLMPFERPLLKSVIGVEVSKLEITKLDTDKLPMRQHRGKNKVSCIVNNIEECRNKLIEAGKYEAQQWNACLASLDKIGVEITHKHSQAGGIIARDLLDGKHDNSNIFIDLTWMNNAINTLSNANLNEIIFLRAEWETISSEYFQEWLNHIKLKPASLITFVILLTVPETKNEEQAHTIIGQMKRRGISVCYDMIEYENRMRVALKHVEWVKISVGLAKRSKYDAEAWSLLTNLVSSAITLEKKVIVPAFDINAISKLVGNLTGSHHSFVHFEGEELNS